MPITIGIPFYNAEEYLSDAIRSVFAQLYAEWELILVDDGSTDNSLEIAMAVRDPRVRVISDGENKRLGYRLNQIVSEAKYELVGRMDADDLMSPSRFQRQVEALDDNPGCDLVTTSVFSITKQFKLIGVRGGSHDDVITGRSLLLGRAPIIHASILGRRSWFLRNPYDETCNRIEDYELWLRAFSKDDFRILVMGEALYFYREEENVSLERIMTAYRGQRDLIKKFGYLGYGSLETLWMVARLHMKSMAVLILTGLGRERWLLKRRNNAIDSTLVGDQLEREIAHIRRTRIPGLD